AVDVEHLAFNRDRRFSALWFYLRWRFCNQKTGDPREEAWKQQARTKRKGHLRSLVLGWSTHVRVRKKKESFAFPQPTLDLREQSQGVVAQDLPADTPGMFHGQLLAVHALCQHFGKALTRHHRGAVNSLGMVAVGAPKNFGRRHHVEPFVKSPLGHMVADGWQPARIDPDVVGVLHGDGACLSDPGVAAMKKDEFGFRIRL